MSAIHPPITRTHAASDASTRSHALQTAIECLPWILGWKLATLGVLIAAYLFLPFNDANQARSFVYPPDPHGLTERLVTWDAAHYLYLADHGYASDQASNAFPPLYPYAIRAIGFLTGDSLVAGLLISNVSSALALYLLYGLAKQRWGRDVATKALLLLLAFPTAFYLNLVYTEGLFLVLAVAMFVLIDRKQWALAAACALLLPLLRTIGIIAVLPLGAALLLDALYLQTDTARLTPHRLLSATLQPRALYALAPLLGLAAYFAFMQLQAGSPFAGFDAQSQYLAGRNLNGLLRPDLFLADLFSPHLKLYDDTDWLLDRALFLFFLASLPLVYRRVELPLFVFYVALGLTPLFGSFMSYQRYLMPAFPLYLAYGQFLAERRPIAFTAVLLPMLLLQALFIAMHTGYSWVG